MTARRCLRDLLMSSATASSIAQLLLGYAARCHYILGRRCHPSPSNFSCTPSTVQLAPGSAMDTISFPNQPRFPPELCLCVIDSLGSETDDDWPEKEVRLALYQCALVCKAWRARAQCWLFRTVTLGGALQCRKFLASIRSSRSPARIAVLQSFVRALALDMDPALVRAGVETAE